MKLAIATENQETGKAVFYFNFFIYNFFIEGDPETLNRFQNLTLEGINKRVYQLKDMVKNFAEDVFPGWYIL